MSKVFFENVSVMPVEDKVDIHFSVLIDEIVSRKKKGEVYLHSQIEIDKKIAEIYSISNDEMQIINRSEQ